MIVKINRQEYEVPDNEPMTGGQIREMAAGLSMVWPRHRVLWEVIPGHQDREIVDADSFTMPQGMRRRFFDSPRFINTGQD